MHISAGTEPFIRPRKHHRARAPSGESRLDLPTESARLRFLAISNAVESKLTHDQRAVFGKVLQTRDVGCESFLRFEVNVETNDIEPWQPQIFRCRIVRVGHHGVGVLGLYHAVKLSQVSLNAPMADETNKSRGDFIAERVA